jgi:hypothetical protein
MEEPPFLGDNAIIMFEEMIACSDAKHKYSGSEYHINAVPRSKFLRDGPGRLYKLCEDCRVRGRNKRKRIREKKLASNLPDGYFMCTTCLKQYPRNEVGKTTQGDDSKCCIRCLSMHHTRNNEFVDFMHAIIIERILYTGLSCIELHEIHLKEPPEGPRGIRRICVVDGGVTFEGKEYQHLEFVRKFQDQLEIRHLECDHLPEDEYKLRYPNGKWLPKSNEVARVSTKEGRIAEMAKCQLISGLGHRIVTARRIARKRLFLRKKWKDSRAPSTRIKQTWVDNYKREKKCRCERCDREHIFEPLSFTHFDHIDIDDKIASVSSMVQYDATLAQLQEEVKKCRLICKHCHAINTSEQRDAGLLQTKGYKTLKRKIKERVDRAESLSMCTNAKIA